MIAKGLMILNCKCWFTFTLLILALIGKCGLFPANLGILGIVDGISLFSNILFLGSNKYIYLIILDFNTL